MKTVANTMYTASDILIPEMDFIMKELDKDTVEFNIWSWNDDLKLFKDMFFSGKEHNLFWFLPMHFSLKV